MPSCPSLRIVSGGQTGVDRAALDAALALDLPCGGWCPRGRRAEDGRIPARYPLRETPLPDYAQRTVWNVRDSDATLLLLPQAPAAQGGTALTIRQAEKMTRPHLVVRPPASVECVLVWLDERGVRTLNVAGPRASEWPDGYGWSRRWLERLLRQRSLRNASSR